MELKVNGESRTVEAQTVGELVRLFGLVERPIVIEVDGAIVARDDWHEATLKAGAKIEIVQFIGGG